MQELLLHKKKMKHQKFDDSLITIPQIYESMETNNTSPQSDNNIPLIT